MTLGLCTTPRWTVPTWRTSRLVSVHRTLSIALVYVVPCAPMVRERAPQRGESPPGQARATPEEVEVCAVRSSRIVVQSPARIFPLIFLKFFGLVLDKPFDLGYTYTMARWRREHKIPHHDCGRG